jgi:hypothetical protein
MISSQTSLLSTLNFNYDFPVTIHYDNLEFTNISFVNGGNLINFQHHSDEQVLSQTMYFAPYCYHTTSQKIISTQN